MDLIVERSSLAELRELFRAGRLCERDFSAYASGGTGYCSSIRRRCSLQRFVKSESVVQVCASNSIGVSMPKAEWRRCRMRKNSR